MLTLFVGWSSGALAQLPSVDCRSNPHLGKARQQYDRLEFDRAAGTLQRAIEHTKNCAWDVAEIYRLKAFVNAVNAQQERCQRAFQILLALDPDYEMPSDVPPKIKSCHARALQAPSERRALLFDHQGVVEVRPGNPVAISVTLTDPLRLVDHVQLFFRREGVQVYTQVTGSANPSGTIVIPALSVPPDEKGYRVEYLLRAVDRWEGTLRALGSRESPLRFQVLPAASKESPITSRWWFWTGLAVVLLGTSAAIFVAQQGGDEVTVQIRDGGVVTGL